MIMCADPLHSCRVCLCEHTHIRSTGADCFDVISPALMTTLICLTTSLLERRREENTTTAGTAASTVPLQADAETDLCINNMLLFM